MILKPTEDQFKAKVKQAIANLKSFISTLSEATTTFDEVQFEIKKLFVTDLNEDSLFTLFAFKNLFEQYLESFKEINRVIVKAEWAVEPFFKDFDNYMEEEYIVSKAVVVKILNNLTEVATECLTTCNTALENSGDFSL